MKKALISPLERKESAIRVVEVVEDGQEYDVCEPFYWIECNDDIHPNHFYFDDNDKTFKLLPNAIHPDSDEDLKIHNQLMNHLLAQLNL
jgi:hypothetical protein